MLRTLASTAILSASQFFCQIWQKRSRDREPRFGILSFPDADLRPSSWTISRTAPRHERERREKSSKSTHLDSILHAEDIAPAVHRQPLSTPRASLAAKLCEGRDSAFSGRELPVYTASAEHMRDKEVLLGNQYPY